MTEHVTEEQVREDLHEAEVGIFGPRLTDDQMGALMSPLHKDRVARRTQGGANLTYLQAYDVKATLIRVFGFGGFSADVVDTTIVRMEKDIPAFSGSGQNRTRKTDEDGQPAFNWSVTAMVTYRLHIHSLGATYTETAAASQTGPDIGEVTDFAIKTAESDALKRAATYLGTQFGLSLYDSGSMADVVKIVFEPQQRAALTRYREARAAANGAQAGQALVDRAMGQQRGGNRENNRARAQMRDEPAPPPYVAGGDNENEVTS